MSLRDEIRNLVSEHVQKLTDEEASDEAILELTRKRIKDTLPLVEEIISSAENGLIQYEVMENWEGYTVAVIIKIGDLRFLGDCSSSDEMRAVSEGTYWYFFPCYSEEGFESWSFNDRLSGHKWFDSMEDLFSHLVPVVAEKIAEYEYNAHNK